MKEKERERGKEGEKTRVGNNVLVREPRLFPITNGAIREPAGGDYF